MDSTYEYINTFDVLNVMHVTEFVRKIESHALTFSVNDGKVHVHLLAHCVILYEQFSIYRCIF